MFRSEDVTEWPETFKRVDLPDLRLTFGGLFGHLLLLEFDFNTTLQSPLLSLVRYGESSEDLNQYYGFRRVRVHSGAERVLQ